MTIDLTGIASAVVAGVFSILAVIVPMMVAKYVGDAQARTVLANAIQNALGAIQAAITAAGPKPYPIPGVNSDVLAGVHYVMDHAADEVSRFSLTPEAIADKINAQIGLRATYALSPLPAAAMTHHASPLFSPTEDFKSPEAYPQEGGGGSRSMFGSKPFKF